MLMLLHVFFTDVNQLRPIHEWALSHPSVPIIFTRSETFGMVLNGHPLKRLPLLRRKTKSRGPRTLKKKKILCGLPPSSFHCFNDATHHTCCLLGGEARKYADKTGNPIGKASEDAFLETYGFPPGRSTLTPWCTCIGSKVCSYYSKRFGTTDGTHIKFINTKNGKINFGGDEDANARVFHSTPGVLW